MRVLNNVSVIEASVEGLCYALTAHWDGCSSNGSPSREDLIFWFIHLLTAQQSFLTYLLKV